MKDKNSLALLSSAFDSLRSYIAVIDKNEQVILMNKAWSEELSEGQKLSDLHPDVREGVKKILQKEASEFHLEFSPKPFAKKRWFFLQVTPFHHEKGGAVISLTDITEHIQVEKLKDEFLSIASHELKTPLTTIKGYIQLLSKYLQNEGTEKTKQYIQQADMYTDKLNQLISRLLDISRIQSGKLVLNQQSIEIFPLITNVVDAMQQLSSKHRILFTSKVNPQTFIDPDRIEQVLMNLLSNAIKYSPDECTIEVDLTVKSPSAVVSVTDHGMGIDPEDQKKIFQRFFRVKNVSKNIAGLGIGLYITSQIVLHHGGKIWVESTPGAGSTFSFTVPLQN